LRRRMSAPSSPWICEASVPKKTGPGRGRRAADRRPRRLR
jgi:hypothetical protein